MASGVKRDGKRSVLRISVSLSEAEAHWRIFLEGTGKAWIAWGTAYCQ